MSTDTIPANESADREAEQPELATVRGFFRKPSWARRVDASGLDPASRDLVLATVRATKLRPKEKLAVADELIAHFHDADHQGIAAAVTRRDFGDPAVAAKLIRRAKKRNRGFFSKLKQYVWWGIGAFLLFYVALAIRFYSGEPEIKVDYLAKLNATAAAVPEDQRAWPEIQSAISEMGLEGPTDVIDLSPVPGDAEWPAVAAFLNEHAVSVERLRRASQLRGLGHVLASTDDPKASAPLLVRTEDLLLPLTALRRVARVLGADAGRAAATGDATTSAEDLIALLALRRFATERPVTLGKLVAISIRSLAIRVLAEVIPAASFNDPQLKEIQVALRQGEAVDFFSGERMIFEDVLQRLYTDDGRGGGRFTAEGSRGDLLFVGGSTPEHSDPSLNLLLDALRPISLLVSGNRRDVDAAHSEILAAAREDLSRPLFEGWKSKPEELLETYLKSPVVATRLSLALRVAPALTGLRETMAEAATASDAAVLALALHRHRLATGTFPDPTTGYTELVPAYLNEVPLDPLHGEPMRWTLRDGQPVIYSLGADGDDDGGVPPVDDLGGNDAAFAAPEKAVDGDWIAWPPA